MRAEAQVIRGAARRPRPPRDAPREREPAVGELGGQNALGVGRQEPKEHVPIGRRHVVVEEFVFPGVEHQVQGRLGLSQIELEVILDTLGDLEIEKL